MRLPTPPQMKNKGNYVISLSEMCRWLGKKAEEAGVEIYSGFAGDCGAMRLLCCCPPSTAKEFDLWHRLSFAFDDAFCPL